MYFESLSAAVAMNGHGVYVWSAYALTAFVLLQLMLAPRRGRRRLLRELRAEQRREATLREDPGSAGVS